jgi:glycosyltransferase involved in cell wall biosynthesis
MRLAFYAPLKPPSHPTPSGDRRMARLLIRALRTAGHRVVLPSRLRSHDPGGDAGRQARIERRAALTAARLLESLRARPPAAWLTYHPYHKSPDWLGPPLSRALAIPYLIVEPSFAPKQADGPWRRGHAATAQAIGRADVVLAMTAADAGCLAPLVRPPARLLDFPPFVEVLPYRTARAARSAHRSALAARFGLDPGRPWLLVVAMMRRDVKRDSYARLAAALARLADLPWHLLVAGDGPARDEIEPRLLSLGPDRVCLLGALDETALPPLYAACDLFVWPALREAYGMVFLEAQAAGLPVVAGDEGGVASVVAHGEGGLLVPPGDIAAFAAAVRALLQDPARRRSMGEAGAVRVARAHDLAPAAARLDAALRAARAIRAERARCASS